MGYEPDLTLAEARAIMDRAISKARRLQQSGGFVIVDGGGGVVTISRMGESATSSIWVARAKAYTAAVQRSPSARNATGWKDNPVNFSAMQTMMKNEIFAGPGGMPIQKEGRIVGGMATAGGVGPWTQIPGIDPSELMVDGVPANAEDLVIAYALQIPYRNQHGNASLSARQDVAERMDDLPHSLDTARRYADRAIEAAQAKGLSVGVAVVDEVGQLMQMDRMDDASWLDADLAEALAQTALNFRRPSIEVGKLPSDRLAEIGEVARFKVLGGGGGVPITVDGHIVGAIGMHGTGNAEASDELARTAISQAQAAVV
jgi:uncharacterized protein GlcG (DUF336 family)